MKENTISTLAAAASSIVVSAAVEYLNTHNLKANPDTLIAVCKSWTKIALPGAIADAKEAFECGMDEIATVTFSASLIEAGIEAAKEASIPAEVATR
jgi:hypothetical protein